MKKFQDLNGFNYTSARLIPSSFRTSSKLIVVGTNATFQLHFGFLALFARAVRTLSPYMLFRFCFCYYCIQHTRAVCGTTCLNNYV